MCDLKKGLASINLIVLPPTVPAMLTVMALRHMIGRGQVDYVFVRNGAADKHALQTYLTRSKRVSAWVGCGPIADAVALLKEDPHTLTVVLDVTSRLAWQRELAGEVFQGLLIRPQNQTEYYTGPARVFQSAVSEDLHEDARRLCELSANAEGADEVPEGIPAMVKKVLERCARGSVKDNGLLVHCITWFTHNREADRIIEGLIKS